MTIAAQKPTIIAPGRPESFGSDCFEVVARLYKVREKGYFLAVPLSMLWKHSEFVASLTERYGKPKIFFVVADADYNLLLEKQRQQPWKALGDRMLLLKDWSDVARVMHAWGCHMENETIATAFIEGDRLVVIDCKLRRLEMKFDQLRSLATVSESERGNFEIGDWGEHLYWPKYDLHVDIIDSILYRNDPEYQKKKDLAALTQNREYGQAIHALRNEIGLTREEIELAGEVSAKTVQRVESGQAELSIKTFEALARAHRMAPNVYLQRLSEIAKETRSPRSAQSNKLEPSVRHLQNPNVGIHAKPSTNRMPEQLPTQIDLIAQEFERTPPPYSDAFANFVSEYPVEMTNSDPREIVRYHLNCEELAKQPDSGLVIGWIMAANDIALTLYLKDHLMDVKQNLLPDFTMGANLYIDRLLCAQAFEASNMASACQHSKLFKELLKTHSEAEKAFENVCRLTEKPTPKDTLELVTILAKIRNKGIFHYYDSKDTTVAKWFQESLRVASASKSFKGTAIIDPQNQLTRFTFVDHLLGDLFFKKILQADCSNDSTVIEDINRLTVLLVDVASDIRVIGDTLGKALLEKYPSREVETH